MVSFCPKCGVLLMPRKNGIKMTLVCHKCGHIEKSNGGSESYVIRESIRHTPRDKITVLEDDTKSPATMPTAKVDCPNCHNNMAAYWQVQTRGADEGSTIFFRCLKCKHTWREY